MAKRAVKSQVNYFERSHLKSQPKNLCNWHCPLYGQEEEYSNTQSGETWSIHLDWIISLPPM